jgi:RNA binding activity-knot of a chromodomain
MWPQGAGKGKRVTVRSPEAAAQSGDALAVIGGGAQNTAEARVTSAQAPAEPEAIVKQEAGSGTAAGVRGCIPEPVHCTACVSRGMRHHPEPVFWADSPVVELQVKLPLEVGTRLRCRWRDGSWHDARIIERRPLPDAKSESDYEYYMHYEKCEAWPKLQPLHYGRQPAAGSLVVGRCALILAWPLCSQSPHGRVAQPGCFRPRQLRDRDLRRRR